MDCLQKPLWHALVNSWILRRLTNKASIHWLLRIHIELLLSVLLALTWKVDHWLAVLIIRLLLLEQHHELLHVALVGGLWVDHLRHFSLFITKL